MDNRLSRYGYDEPLKYTSENNADDDKEKDEQELSIIKEVADGLEKKLRRVIIESFPEWEDRYVPDKVIELENGILNGLTHFVGRNLFAMAQSHQRSELELIDKFCAVLKTQAQSVIERREKRERDI